MNKYKRKAQFL